MCQYIQQVPLCGHAPTVIILEVFCHRVKAELGRIHTDPAAWAPGNVQILIPFDPNEDYCDPSPQNTRHVAVRRFCGQECRNNYARRDGGPWSPAVTGEEGARYGKGSERKGIGFQ